MLTPAVQTLRRRLVLPSRHRLNLLSTLALTVFIKTEHLIGAIRYDGFVSAVS